MGCGASSKKKEKDYEAKEPTATAAAPPADSVQGALRNGMRVRIDGLTGAVELNGKEGTISGFTESTGRYVVEVDGGVGQKSLKEANLTAAATRAAAPTRAASQASNKEPESRTPEKKQAAAASKPPEKKQTQPVEEKTSLEIGDRVRVGGLNGAIELNGQCAVVFGHDQATGRYIVEFENGQGVRKMKSDNLTPMGTATGALAAKARMMAGIS